jgi:dihydroflavonol-4-reductase
MKPILVTGAGGFIGSHVARALVARGEEVRGLLYPGESRKNLEGLDLEPIEADVRDADAMERAAAGCRAIVHLASVYAVWMRRPTDLLEINVDGTRNVLDAAMAARVGRVIVTTSQGLWAGRPRGFLIDETTIPNEDGCLDATGDLYCRSKLDKHELVREYARRGLDVLSVAPAVPFGPGDLRPTPTGQILTSLVNLPLFTYVDTIINPVDVRDVAEGHVLALERGAAGEAYLLGGPDNITMSELIAEARNITGAWLPAVRVPSTVALVGAHVLRFVADHLTHRAPPITPPALRVARNGFRLRCDKARDQLGFRPRPWPESVRDALVWFAENGYLRSRRTRRALTAPTPLALPNVEP